MPETDADQDKWEPDYNGKCCNCGQSPVVTSVNIATGKTTYSSEMCGPCTFGEADCVDPDNW